MVEKTIKNRNTFNLMCYVKKTKVLKNGESPVFLRITVNRKIAEISMKGTISASLWDQAKERSRGKSPEDIELNNYINSVKSRLINIHRELEIEDNPVSAEIIKNIFLGNDTKKEDGKTLIEVHSDHNERCRKLLGIEYSQSTIYKFDASLKYLKEFMSLRLDRKDIPLKEINEDFIRNYELYVKTEKGCANNSAIKHLKIFKKITRIAVVNDWLQKDPFANIKFRQDEVHVDFLTIEELNKIMEKNLPCKRLEQVRDVFIFCCFTGLAFVDVKGLRQEHITKGNNGDMWIRKPRQKTNNMCNIPLLKIPKTLLEKYSADKNCELTGQLLPVPTNQKMNAYLKEIADLCGITKQISSHLARHSFATLTLTNKVTMENVAKMLGHSSTRMTQHYAKVLDQSILEDMMNVDSKLFANL